MSQANSDVFFSPAGHVWHVPALPSPQPMRTWPAGHAAQSLQVDCLGRSWYLRSAPEHVTWVSVPSHMIPAAQSVHSRSLCVPAALVSYWPSAQTVWSMQTRSECVPPFSFSHCVAVQIAWPWQMRSEVFVGAAVSNCLSVQVV